MLKITIILLVAFALRLYGINWDQGIHLHPDERMLMIVAERLHFFDKLNPDFFNYGSLPIYLLRGLAQLLDSTGFNFGNYEGMLYLGRFLSASVDTLSAFFVYLIARFLFKDKKIALLSSFFYAIAFFPIQNGHFFIVDTFLTFFVTVLLYVLLLYLKKPHWKKTLLMALFAAAAVTTKFTAIIFLPIVFIVLVLRNVILGTPESGKRHPESRRDVGMKDPIINRILRSTQNDNVGGVEQGALSAQARMTLFDIILFTSSFLVFSFLFMPYAYLDWQKFLIDILLQIKLNNDAYIFPYTLQYVGTFPYLYYLKNILLWGLGPFLSFFSILGLYFLLKNDLSLRASAKQSFSKMRSPRPPTSRRSPRDDIVRIFLFLGFYLFYFLVIGRSAVKFMRYMLPIYPFLTILAGYGLYRIIGHSRPDRESADPHFHEDDKGSFRLIGIVIVTLAVMWSLMFVNIYSYPHTRISATGWINQNIPEGSTLAVEHWDDALPLSGGEKYNFVELTLYDQPDDQQKWNILNEKLIRSDYVSLSSNRLYIPLQKLEDCSEFLKCYPLTAKYYRELFSGRLGFQKAAEFTVYPSFQIGSWKLEIPDDRADESFTVYDHPKVLIFKRNN